MGIRKWRGILRSFDASSATGTFAVGTESGGGAPAQALTYSAAPAWPVDLGVFASLTITNNVAFVIAEPTLNGVAFSALASSAKISLAGGVFLLLNYRNTSGVAHGAGSFNAIFKVSGNLAAVATGFNRTIAFVWNGTNFLEVWRTAADVAN